jgi:hypothetical protein
MSEVTDITNFDRHEAKYRLAGSVVISDVNRYLAAQHEAVLEV